MLGSIFVFGLITMIQSPVQDLIHLIDKWVKPLIYISVGLYIIELITGAKDSYQAHKLFLWSERFIATVFTVEYIFRWYSDSKDNVGWHYPHSPLGIIDLISILPFWIGFFVPTAYIHYIRGFRVFRLFKLFRYNRGLQLVALGFYRAWHQAKPLVQTLCVIGLFCTVAMYEIESHAQPEKFSNLIDSAYFTMVTVATVGYGDISPVTLVGRLVAIFTFLSALIVFAGILGIVGVNFSEIIKEEIDPNIDPIEEFKKENERYLLQKALS